MLTIRLVQLFYNSLKGSHIHEINIIHSFTGLTEKLVSDSTSQVAAPQVTS